jgi:hypothetical protein
MQCGGRGASGAEMLRTKAKHGQKGLRSGLLKSLQRVNRPKDDTD